MSYKKFNDLQNLYEGVVSESNQIDEYTELVYNVIIAEMVYRGHSESVIRTYLENISEEQIKFLKILSNSLSEIEWNNELITESIQECANLSEIKRRDAFLAIYWITLGKSFGPKASSLIFEIGKDEITKLIALI